MSSNRPADGEYFPEGIV